MTTLRELPKTRMNETSTSPSTQSTPSTTQIQSSMPELRRSISITLESTKVEKKQFSQPTSPIEKNSLGSLSSAVKEKPIQDNHHQFFNGVDTAQRNNSNCEWDDFEEVKIPAAAVKSEPSATFKLEKDDYHIKRKNIVTNLELL